MAEDFDYLHIVEWDDSVIRPPITVMHKIKLNPDVSSEDFENHFKEKGFPKIITRAGGAVKQYLLTKASNPPGRFEMLDLDIEGFGEQTSVTSYRIVNSGKEGEENDE